MISFADLTKQVHSINDLILTDMICVNDDTEQEASSFSRHLLATKSWFARISWANKKRYVLALMEDVRSAWALSLLLKSMWNCRPKDSVLSVSEQTLWSSYDQVPMDHNRTALPMTALAQVMKNDRIWFLALEPEAQAMVLSELLTVSGGPIMWAVLHRAQVLYQRYRDQQLQNLKECIVVNDPPPEKSQQTTPERGKKEPQSRKSSVGSPDTVKHEPGNAQKELEANLAAWNATIKSMRGTSKIEEVEMTFKDGTKKKIWKVNRQKPEVIETVDFIQLLPLSIGMRILSYLPRTHLGEYANVNKYWAFLVDELRAELTARQKINSELDRLREVMLRHDTSLEQLDTDDFPIGPPSSQAFNSMGPSTRLKHLQPSVKASEKSGGAYSLRHFLNEKFDKPALLTQTPVRNMAELTERIERRGAADENIWKWCDNAVMYDRKIKKDKQVTPKVEEGVLPLVNIHFPCPMMKQTVKIPLDPPLFKDPAKSASLKPKRNISNATVFHAGKDQAVKKISLWTRNFSSLYPVFKIASYQSPV